MDVTLKGSAEFRALLEDIGGKLRRNMPAVLQQYANEIAIDAKHNHRFTSRTNSLEDSITPLVSASGMAFKVFLDPTWTTDNSSDYSYGVGVHQGTKRNGRTIWKKDPFIFRAFQRKEKHLITATGRVLWRTLNQPK